jgi:hypothetical protein
MSCRKVLLRKVFRRPFAALGGDRGEAAGGPHAAELRPCSAAGLAFGEREGTKRAKEAPLLLMSLPFSNPGAAVPVPWSSVAAFAMTEQLPSFASRLRVPARQDARSERILCHVVCHPSCSPAGLAFGETRRHEGSEGSFSALDEPSLQQPRSGRARPVVVSRGVRNDGATSFVRFAPSRPCSTGRPFRTDRVSYRVPSALLGSGPGVPRDTKARRERRKLLCS